MYPTLDMLILKTLYKSKAVRSVFKFYMFIYFLLSKHLHLVSTVAIRVRMWPHAFRFFSISILAQKCFHCVFGLP